MPVGRVGRLFAVLVTYRRPVQLAETLRRVAAQEHPPEVLVVVDNAPDAASEALVREAEGDGLTVEYLPSEDNLGPAGGIAVGMGRVLELAGDADWVLLLDDDDPPLSPAWFGDLLAFGGAVAAREPSVGGVGFGGGRFHWLRARLVRPPYERFQQGPVEVDYFPSGHLPLYRVGALRSVGTFHPDLFFGLDDVEFGLRLRRAGFSLHGLRPPREVARAERATIDRMKQKRPIGVRYRLAEEPDWREYYALRNTIHILRSFGHRWTALRVALVRGVAKPLLNAALSPRLGFRHLRMRWRAARDGLAGRLGRTIDPPAPVPDRASGRVPRRAWWAVRGSSEWPSKKFS